MFHGVHILGSPSNNEYGVVAVSRNLERNVSLVPLDYHVLSTSIVRRIAFVYFTARTSGVSQCTGEAKPTLVVRKEAHW